MCQLNQSILVYIDNSTRRKGDSMESNLILVTTLGEYIEILPLWQYIEILPLWQ